MTRQDAAQILGVDLGERPDRKAVKRAYLRQVKTTSPEQDPEGFARLRQAYELLDNFVSWHEPSPVPLPATPIHHETPPSNGEANETQAEDGYQDEYDDDDDDELAPYYERLNALREDAPWGQRAEIAREALKAFPDNESARRLLLRYLPLENDFARGEALAVLLAGVEKGQLAFFPALVRHAPERVPAAAIEKASQLDDPELKLAVIEIASLQNAGVRAVDLLDELTKGIDERGLSSAYLEEILRAVLIVVAKNGSVLGREGFRRVEKNLNLAAIDWLTVSPQAAFYFGVITEFPAIATMLPEFILRSIAADVVWDDRGASPRAIANHLPVLGRRDRKRLKESIPKLAPTIYQIISPGFEAPRKRAFNLQDELDGRALFVLAWLALSLYRACSN